MKCSLLDCSYQTDGDKPSFRTTSYWTDEVQPAGFLIPDGLGQAHLSHDFVLDRRSPACLIPRTRGTMTCPPIARLRTGQTKSCLIDSSYLTDVDKLSLRDFVLEGRSLAYLIRRTSWTRTCSPFARPRNRCTKSLPHASWYPTDEDKLSFHTTSYRTDKVSPT